MFRRPLRPAALKGRLPSEATKDDIQAGGQKNFSGVRNGSLKEVDSDERSGRSVYLTKHRLVTTSVIILVPLLTD